MAGPNPFSKTLPLTSLGAVGGPRGTAAGVLRVLVDFAVTYDGERVKQLEAEIQKLQQIESRAKQRQNQYLTQQSTLETRIQNIQQTRRQLNTAQNRALDLMVKRYDQINRIQENINKGGVLSPRRQAAFQREQQILQGQIQQMAQQTGIGQVHLQQALRYNQALQERTALQNRLAINEANLLDLEEKIGVRQQEAGMIAQFREQALPRLGGLAVGAIGNIFGGALLGVGFQAGYLVVDKITERLRDMVDPAVHARENLQELAQAIASVGSDTNLSNLQKAQQYLTGLGPGGTSLRSGSPQIDQVLSLAVATNKLNEAQDALNKAVAQGTYGQELYEDALRKVGNFTVQQSQEFKTLKDAIDAAAGSYAQVPEIGDVLRTLETNPFQVTGDQLQALVSAGVITQQIADDFLRMRSTSEDNLRLWSTGSDALGDAAKNAAAFADELERATNAALDAQFDANLQAIADAAEAKADAIRSAAQSALNAVSQQADLTRQSITDASEARINQLQDRLGNLRSGPSARTRGIQNRINNLGSGDSARTRALQAQIDRLNAAQERRAYLASLASIAEERYQLKLQHSLEMGNKAINIYKFAGKARLIAIDASIARIQKEQAAQDRLNKLLDLQYEASKRINREEGETIQEFLDRRAQEYRHQIADRMALERQSKIDRLEGLKEETEYRIALAENQQKRLETIRERERKLHMDHLQALLAASKEADRAAQQAQRDNLQKQLAASQEADRRVLEAKRKAIQNQIEEERKLRDARIRAIDAAEKAQRAAIEAQRERDLKANEKNQEYLEKAEKKRQETIKRYANRSESDRLIAAMKGAKNLAELNAIAGHLAGTNAAWAQLSSYINSLGLSAPQAAMLVANIASQRAAYQAALKTFQNKAPIGGMASGGVFELTNSMNFGRNMRVGEGGREIGIVLSNRVVQALEARRGGPMIGTLNIVANEDPVQAAYRMKRTVRELQESQL